MTIKDFDEKLAKYAELIVRVGVNVQPKQLVVLYISVTQQKLARLMGLKQMERLCLYSVMVIGPK